MTEQTGPPREVAVTARLDPRTTEAVLALADAVATEDGVEAFSEQSLLELRRPVRDVRHVLVGGESPLGYAQLDLAGASAELAVHPAHRRRGVGGALLDGVRGLAPGVAVWAHGDLPAARALAAAAGMTRARTLLQMSVDLPAPGVPAETVPAAHGLDGVRTFRVGEDEEAWVELNARAFADHPEQGRMTVADVRAREAESWFDPSVLWLAADTESGTDTETGTGTETSAGSAGRGRLLASMWVKIVRDEPDGEIYVLGVAPDAQGRGLGSRLTSLALAEMAARGLARATLYVEGDNTAALRTYEKKGFRCVAIDVQYR